MVAATEEVSTESRAGLTISGVSRRCRCAAGSAGRPVAAARACACRTPRPPSASRPSAWAGSLRGGDSWLNRARAGRRRHRTQPGSAVRPTTCPCIGSSHGRARRCRAPGWALPPGCPVHHRGDDPGHLDRVRRLDRRERGAAVDPGRPRRRAGRAAVDRRRLSAHARIVHPRRRLARRHLRRRPRVHDRRGELRRGVGALCGCADLDDADRLPRAPGPRRRAPHARVARDPHVDVLRRRARRRDRDLDRVERDLVHHRAADRRMADRRVDVARDLPDQRAGRARDDRSSPTARCRGCRRGERASVSTIPARRSARPGSAASSSASSSSRDWAGAAPPCCCRSSAARPVSPRSCCTRRGRRSRCCRCACSRIATSRSRTSRRSPCTAACPRGASSSRCSCNSSRAGPRFRPASPRCR